MVKVLGSTVVFGVGNAPFPVRCRPLTRATNFNCRKGLELGLGLGTEGGGCFVSGYVRFLVRMMSV